MGVEADGTFTDEEPSPDLSLLPSVLPHVIHVEGERGRLREPRCHESDGIYLARTIPADGIVAYWSEVRTRRKPKNNAAADRLRGRIVGDRYGVKNADRITIYARLADISGVCARIRTKKEHLLADEALCASASEGLGAFGVEPPLEGVHNCVPLPRVLRAKLKPWPSDGGGWETKVSPDAIKRGIP
jgi:hypothetical protein